jgi:hypothetical protein
MYVATLTRRFDGRWTLAVAGAAPITFAAYFTSQAIDDSTARIVELTGRRNPTWTRSDPDTWKFWA